MKCTVCPKSADVYGRVLLNQDGDFACSDWCAKKYFAERNDFFNRIVQSEHLTERYLRGEEV